MLRGAPQLVSLPSSAPGCICFAVDLVVDRHDAPRVAVRGGSVDVANVLELGDERGGRKVRFLVEADAGPADYDVSVIVAVGGSELVVVGPHVPARNDQR
jgi:hypothetical protein